ncbi:MAG: hypothetical protein IJE43_18750 [Alphaproteobacteria bacterium]|nr:hypothetical protein [Alphaproteobacteria bacterium]
MSKFLKINRFFAILVLAVLFISCSDNNNSNDGLDFNDEELSEEEIAILNERINDVTNDVESYVAKVSSIEELEKYIDEISENPNIDSAWIENGALGVKVKDGGLIIYDEGMPYDDSQSRTSQTLPTENLQAIKSRLAEVSRKNISQINNIQDNTLSRSTEKFLHGCKNKKVLLFNAIGEDDIQKYLDDNIKALLESMFGVFEVTAKQGEECTADFILKNFHDYGLILMVAHGNYFGGEHWIITGERANDLELLWLNDYDEYLEWVYGSQSIYYNAFDVNLGRCLAISETAIKDKMQGKFDENSILYAVTCQTFKKNNNLANAFRDHGLGAFIGFDNNVLIKYGIDGFIKLILHDMIFSRSAIDFSEEGIEHKEISLMESYNDNKNIFSDWSGTFGTNTQMCISCESDDIAVFSTINSEEVVNLGFPTNWAGCNIGAKSPEEFGEYYQIYEGIDIKKIISSFFGSIDENRKYYCNMDVIYDKKYDKANKLLGDEWCLPDTFDILFITDFCKSKKYKLNDINGKRITGVSGESIFLPMAGYVYVNEYGESKMVSQNSELLYPTSYMSYDPISKWGYSVDKDVVRVAFSSSLTDWSDLNKWYWYYDSWYQDGKYKKCKYPIRAVKDNPFYNNQQSKSTQNSMIQCAKISN